MKKSRKISKKWMAVGVLAAVLTVSGVAFAAFTEMLTIQGSAAFESNAPLVRWQLGSVERASTGGASFDANITTNISADQLLIASYRVLFVSPGEATIRATIENVGAANAQVGAVNVPTIACTPQGETDQIFANAICAALTYTFTYADGSPISTGNVLEAVGGNNEVDVVVTLTLGSLPTVGMPGLVYITIGDQTITFVEE